MSNSAAAASSEKEFLIALLRESCDTFLGSFAGVSDLDSRRKPTPDRWCVLETVEHLTAAETLQSRLVLNQRVPRPSDAPNREQIFLTVVADRSRKMESPESARPCGRFANLAEAAAQFTASREAVIGFLEDCTEDLRATQVRHPHPAAGDVSTFEMLIIMSRHAERHAKQIDETKAALGIGNHG